MPRILRERLPDALMAHLVRRIREREISATQLGLFAQWVDSNPEVPEGQWFKRFPELIVCGEGALVKILAAGTGSGRGGTNLGQETRRRAFVRLRLGRHVTRFIRFPPALKLWREKSAWRATLVGES